MSLFRHFYREYDKSQISIKTVSEIHKDYVFTDVKTVKLPIDALKLYKVFFNLQTPF